MKPKRMMIIRASNLEAVNKSWTLVAALTLIQFTNVREATGGGGIEIRDQGLGEQTPGMKCIR